MGLISQLSVRNVSDQLGHEGQVVSPPSKNDERAYAHTAGRALQIYNIVVDASPTATTDYSITALGETVTFEATGTRATDVNGLVAAFNADPLLRGVFTASNSSDTTVVLTANSYGTDITVTVADESTSELTLSEATAPANATQILAGRAVYRDGSGGVTMTNPNSDLSALAGFARRLEASEQTSVGSDDNDLYEANETVAVMKTCRMIQAKGSAAVEGDELWIEQSAGANLGRAYTSSGATTHTLVITPTVSNGATYTISLTIDGTPVYAEVTGDGSDTVKEVVEALQAELALITPTSLLTATEDDATLTITLADPDATLGYSLSDNLVGVEANDGTRLKLPATQGQWADIHEIEFKLGI